MSTEIENLTNEHIVFVSNKSSPIFGLLSSYNQRSIVVDDIEYKSPEHAIQSIRMFLLGKKQSAQHIRRSKTPHSARRCGDIRFERDCNEALKVIWYREQIRILIKVLTIYVLTYEDVKEALLATGEAHLESFHQDRVRGARENIDGFVYTYIRSRLREDGR